MEEDRRSRHDAEGWSPELIGSLPAAAERHGIATSYRGADGSEVAVPPATLEAVLAALGVDSQDAEERTSLPALVVVRAGQPAQVAHHSQSAEARAELRLEAGDAVTAQGKGQLDLPALPAGIHVLDDGESSCAVIASPGPCRRPEDPQWGWMLQLYALRSQGSWGIGDLRDLRTIAEHSGREQGAGFVLVNPLHAATPGLPQQPSPYYPSSRRFTNPLWLRPEDVPEAGALPGEEAERFFALAREAQALNIRDHIDRDHVWRLKIAALEMLARCPTETGRIAAFAHYREQQGDGLEQFARFCAFAERHGGDFTRWPEGLRHPDRPQVAAEAGELAERVRFHAWLQWLADEQLATCQRSAVAAGMPIGVVHDLAVGVDPGGADAWALQDELAHGVTQGAPPDAFNQRGQDWKLPPLRPDRLVATRFAPFRELLRRQLEHGGGLRVDHALGLFRQFWIPEGATAAAGTYVTYPAAALLAVIELEAHAAGAVVIGEDLGNIAPGVREALGEAGALGSRVVYFERRDDGARLPAEQYPRDAMVSVNTHDLPTAAGWLAGQDVAAQHAADLLPEGTRPEDELAQREQDRASLIGLLRGEGLLDEAHDGDAVLRALHAFLARTPCRLRGANPQDAIGDTRQLNLPGSSNEYPNWSLPLSRQDGSRHRPVGVEEWLGDPGTIAVARILRGQ